MTEKKDGSIETAKPDDNLEFLRAWGTDQEKEESGKWFPTGVKNRNGDEMRLKISRAQTKKHRAFLENSLSEEEKAIISEFSFEDPEYASVAAKIFAHCLLHDWSGFLDRNGMEIKFTVKKAQEQLQALRMMRAFVLSKSTRWENYRIELEGAIIKN